MHRHFTENALNNVKSKTTKKPALEKKKGKVEAKERKNLKNKKERKKQHKWQENAMWNKYKEHLDAMRKCWII